MDKRGDLTGIFYLVVMIAGFAIFLLILAYIVPQITTPLKNAIGTSTIINSSLDASTNVALNTLPTIWLILFTFLFIGLIITAFFIDTHPVFVPFFIILLVVAIIVSVPLSNAYEQLTETAQLSSISLTQSSINYVMIYLPFITLIIGLIIMVVAFAKPGAGSASLG